MSHFDKCLYFSANKMTRHLNSIAEQAFKPLDITPTQGFTLICIEKLNKHTPSEIAAELEMTPSTITRFLDKLENHGYVERTYQGKTSNVNITQSGKDMVSEVQNCWERVHDLIVDSFGKETSKEITQHIMQGNKIYNDRHNK